MEDNTITASPIRIIPFDLGRSLSSDDKQKINRFIDTNYTIGALSAHQSAIIKNIFVYFRLNANISVYIYKNGITVVAIKDEEIELSDNPSRMAAVYGEDRKKAHKQLFRWEHSCSEIVFRLIENLREIIKSNTKKETVRKSASVDFENKGMSYVMTISFFNISSNIRGTRGFNGYPEWLKKNLYAILDPASIYLEDSSRFESVQDAELDIEGIIGDMVSDEPPKDYERHRHIETYMSWAAVVILGHLHDSDKEEYVTLEVQLQCDWYYVYCLEKNLNLDDLSKNSMIECQHQNYELDILKNRIYDFDDSSIPARVLDIQKGLIMTSGLEDNIDHAQRKINYILERERLNNELRQKKIGQSSEIFLFIIAFIEIAPTVAEYGNKIFPNCGLIANCLLVLIGTLLLKRKE